MAFKFITLILFHLTNVHFLTEVKPGRIFVILKKNRFNSFSEREDAGGAKVRNRLATTE